MTIELFATIRANDKTETFEFPTSLKRMDKKFGCDVNNGFEILYDSFPGKINGVTNILILNNIAKYLKGLPFIGLLNKSIIDDILNHFGTSIFEIAEKDNFQLVGNEYIPEELKKKVVDLGQGYSAFIGREIPIELQEEGK